ncbi:MAG: hypothetical protein AUK47_00425 [Deltaproteobacteria bacterium CG2_30_63_29]|nr:MAG: hypothetical protein AUK47_00425 [Deltaproteobacteria bacterium CG2_30_63_29]
MSPNTPNSDSDEIIDVGSVIDDRYEIISFLGEGGFATVYKARHIHINRFVAIKLLNIGVKVPKSSEFEERFLREAQTAAQIEHPNVVTIHDFGFAGSIRQPYIVMELLEGHDLEDELKKNGPMEPKRLLKLMPLCLEALAEGHKAGIVHKDLKPSNLFLSFPFQDKEMLRILDFGVATINQGGKRITSTGQILGTPQYLAPEYITNQISTPALDVYQMGLILVEALTGVPVVDFENPFQCLMAHCKGNLNIPEKILTGPLGPVLERALAINYEKRYQDAGEFREALLAIDPESIAPLTPEDLAQLGALKGTDELSNLALAQTMAELDDLSKQNMESLQSSADLRLRQAEEADEARATAFDIDRSKLLSPTVAMQEELSLERDELKQDGLPTWVLAAAVILLIAGLLGAIVYFLQMDTGKASTEEAANEPVPDEPTKGPAKRTEKDASSPPDVAEAVPVPDVVEAPPETAAVVAPKPDAVEDLEAPLAMVSTVFVTSEPSGAQVFRAGELLGETPLPLKFTTADIVLLRFEKKGFDSLSESLVVKDDATLLAKLKRKKRLNGSDPVAQTDPAKDGGKDTTPKDDKSEADKKKDEMMMIAP